MASFESYRCCANWFDQTLKDQKFCEFGLELCMKETQFTCSWAWWYTKGCSACGFNHAQICTLMHLEHRFILSRST